jgi:polar amino acid transport system substrate-binding protein
VERGELKKGLKPFTPVYTKDDAAQTLALQSGRADAFFGPNVIGAWKAALTGKTKLVGSVDGGWPKAAHIAVTLKKGSGLVEPVQTALNGASPAATTPKCLTAGGRRGEHSAIGNQPGRTGRLTGGAMSEHSAIFLRKRRSCSRLLRACSANTPPATATIFPAMRKWS